MTSCKPDYEFTDYKLTDEQREVLSRKREQRQPTVEEEKELHAARKAEMRERMAKRRRLSHRSFFLKNTNKVRRERMNKPTSEQFALAEQDMLKKIIDEVHVDELIPISGQDKLALRARSEQLKVWIQMLNVSKQLHSVSDQLRDEQGTVDELKELDKENQSLKLQIVKKLAERGR